MDFANEVAVRKHLGWDFAREGKKATNFSTVCRALGVEFNFANSGEKILKICNAETRRLELVAELNRLLSSKRLGKHDSLVLRGRLGFADSYIHGRLGKLILKQLVDHAYGGGDRLSSSLLSSMRAVKDRLEFSDPMQISAKALETWSIYTDASYEPGMQTGGLGGALVDPSGNVASGFGMQLDSYSFGSSTKGTIIYELEMLAEIIGMALWCDGSKEKAYLCFSDNDGVKFSLIRGTANGEAGVTLLRFNLECKNACDITVWFARVPTEANLSDHPSRGVDHPLLTAFTNVTDCARVVLSSILAASTS